MILITTANFRSGGKSSIARLLAEKLNTTILNFDKKRDSEAYNVVSTINIPENKSIERKEDCLILRDKTTEQTIKTKSNYLICDLGGYFDERLVDLKSDFYIIPSFDDYESISESMRTAHYILKNNIKAKIIFVLNGAFIVDKTTKDEKIKEKNGEFATTKKDKNLLHGIGIKNVRKVVSDLNGQIDISYTDDTFHVGILLPNYE